jgi:glycolate oxidase FAD binding subunit
MNAELRSLHERVRAAAADGRPIRLRGSGSKDFYGQTLAGDVVDTRGYAGVVAYEPTELVITARCGTRLAEIESLLAERGQMLAFEPPHFGPDATLGGCVSAGLSGPRRPAAGGVRDFVLGVKLIDGHAELMSFGGQVMKNVAGYDVSRLVCGALGTLGLIAEVSLKVLPKPFEESTLLFRMDQAQALDKLNEWGGQPLPVSASAFCDGALALRLSGAGAAVRAARDRLGGEPIDPQQAQEFWSGIREQTDPFFDDDDPLWRLSVPSIAGPLDPPGRQLIEWGGALRWLESAAPAQQIREAAHRAGGHATLFRAADKAVPVFQPLPAALQAIHRRLKQAFDPMGIFNPGRMYSENRDE